MNPKNAKQSRPLPFPTSHCGRGIWLATFPDGNPAGVLVTSLPGRLAEPISLSLLHRSKYGYSGGELVATLEQLFAVALRVCEAPDRIGGHYAFPGVHEDAVPKDLRARRGRWTRAIYGYRRDHFTGDLREFRFHSPPFTGAYLDDCRCEVVAPEDVEPPPEPGEAALPIVKKRGRWICPHCGQKFKPRSLALLRTHLSVYHLDGMTASRIVGWGPAEMAED